MAEVVDTTMQDNTPLHSQGFGPAEQSDETRQAQQQAANDVPVDVNPNAIVARTQAAAYVEQQGTLTLMGKAFADNADRRGKMFDHLATVMMAGIKVPA